ncbi:hypothetical protein K5D56_14010 [Pseudomonas cichorii]|uniref:hypothetical protein n=1 Tax=Pseudomonas cichorii TaxID=36746 RepID=UPI0019110556|nr:hypothetical protein [Pseudomonas cichorii]MBX8540123.1 hypothetical protein [Pseudomonas cichorii]MBX8560588.1 hypothetical protein [Pseudomonas cichorii]MBX8567061.1 hypothetical protein [Pseudomonas cichorii]MBX8579693.1 hypothetical protein [Pseudomonas cichorii]MBX8590489.1 hypothetical protein [Pseudomonas cichorii]
MNNTRTPLPLTHLPHLSPRPENAADHTGKRRGKMTAIAWYRPSRSGKGTLWWCRCDCGLFEYRRPGTWESRRFPDDMCNSCLKAEGPNARHTAPERLQRWMDGMRSLGLNDMDIARIQAPGMMVETKGKTAAEIRQQMVNVHM